MKIQIFKNSMPGYYSSFRIKNLAILAVCFFTTMLWSNLIIGQCPSPCTTQSLSVSTTTFPLCGNRGTELSGDVNDDSDCENVEGSNCFEFVITRPNIDVNGFVADVGVGPGCIGQANIFYTLIDGVCSPYASPSSQDMFNFEFGVSDEIRVYICGNASGQVSLCNICADVDCPDPTAIIQISQN